MCVGIADWSVEGALGPIVRFKENAVRILGMTSGEGNMSTFDEENGEELAMAQVLKVFCSLDRMKAIATFGGLLVQPALHSNCHRIESLVHMAARFATGQKKSLKPLTQSVEGGSCLTT